MVAGSLRLFTAEAIGALARAALGAIHALWPVPGAGGTLARTAAVSAGIYALALGRRTP